MSDDGKTPCMECGMPCRPHDYHPYAACLMFKACGDYKTVLDNLDAVRADGYQIAVDKEVVPLKSCERSMAVAIEMALERIEEPPEANCSCHLSPPCNDCVEFGGAREAFDEMRAALKSYTNRHEVMNPPASAARGAEARNLTSANVMGLGEVHRASEARPADDVPAPVRIATLQNEIRQIENHCHSYKLVADGSYEQCIYEMDHSQKTKELNALQYSSKPLAGEPTYECNGCDWKGPESETVYPKHVPDARQCPECHETCEPAQKLPGGVIQVPIIPINEDDDRRVDALVKSRIGHRPSKKLPDEPADERENPFHPAYIGDLELPQPTAGDPLLDPDGNLAGPDFEDGPEFEGWEQRSGQKLSGEQCRDDGRCQYAIDHGAEGMGHCPPGKCSMPRNQTP